ncbi:unnamed protein product [Moneuplotes crassus]|uniref:Uncharacterized protein n=1 Tax=Euplotes crassus TaxID=5936 RepID=A0AAD2D7R2_EUPCR|nr:unnamed protein product [Moneuplotes crassus]
MLLTSFRAAPCSSSQLEVWPSCLRVPNPSLRLVADSNFCTVKCFSIHQTIVFCSSSQNFQPNYQILFYF